MNWFACARASKQKYSWHTRIHLEAYPSVVHRCWRETAGIIGYTCAENSNEEILLETDNSTSGCILDKMLRFYERLSGVAERRVEHTREKTSRNLWTEYSTFQPLSSTGWAIVRELRFALASADSFARPCLIAHVFSSNSFCISWEDFFFFHRQWN
jgi:hypothetical protein